MIVNFIITGYFNFNNNFVETNIGKFIYFLILVSIFIRKLKFRQF